MHRIPDPQHYRRRTSIEKVGYTSTTAAIAAALGRMGWAGEAGRHEAGQTAGGGGPASSPAPAAGHLPATSQLQVPRPAYIIDND
jgi:hypothetical protein